MGAVNEKIYDCIVIGSGPSGAMCAQTLVEAGINVLMIDGGIKSTEPEWIPENDLSHYRQSGFLQENFFLGSSLQSLQWQQMGTGEQLTPQRQYVTAKTSEWLRSRSATFQPMESLAYGGLGGAWGLGCYCFSKDELELCGLPPVTMREAYRVIASRIGIAYSKDDIEPYTMPGIATLPAIDIDENAKTIFLMYQQKKQQFNEKDFYLGIPSLALLTKNFNERKATDYSNLDFYVNKGLSAYRPSLTIDTLREFKNFQYEGGLVVLTFKEQHEKVQVEAKNMKDGTVTTFYAKKIAVACGALSTARIVLRSYDRYNTQVPLLCNPYSYVTCISWKRLGKVPSGRNTSTAQLALFHNEHNQNKDIAMASLYSYTALPVSKVLKELPLNFRDGLHIMQYFLPAMLIAGIHHPDETSAYKFVELKNEEAPMKDVLLMQYSLTEKETVRINAREKMFMKVFRQLGCIPVKKIRPPHGASIHYAGTLPYRNDRKPLSTSSNGLLAGTKNVFIADGSGFNYLPAKGITFSLMANAHRIALEVLKNE